MLHKGEHPVPLLKHVHIQTRKLCQPRVPIHSLVGQPTNVKMKSLRTDVEVAEEKLPPPIRKCFPPLPCCEGFTSNTFEKITH